MMSHFNGKRDKVAVQVMTRCSRCNWFRIRLGYHLLSLSTISHGECQDGNLMCATFWHCCVPFQFKCEHY